MPIIHIVDDEPAVLDSLRFLLGPDGWDIRTYDRATSILAATLSPLGCILTDYNMPEMDGIQLHEELQKRKNRLPVIVMSGCGDIPIAVRAMKAGAIDFLEKPFSDNELRSAIENALGQNQKAVADFAICDQAARRISLLTPREHEVMKCVASGKSNKEIASIFEISPRTIDVHRARVMQKLGVSNLPELMHLLNLAEQTVRK